LVLAEHGAIMASIVLNAPRAKELSIYLVQAFAELRSMLATHRESSQKLYEPQNTLSALAAECGSGAFSGLKTQEGFAQNWAMDGIDTAQHAIVFIAICAR
jgi:hypothetical protein